MCRVPRQIHEERGFGGATGRFVVSEAKMLTNVSGLVAGPESRLRAATRT
jgi:hypothetical protein